MSKKTAIKMKVSPKKYRLQTPLENVMLNRLLNMEKKTGVSINKFTVIAIDEKLREINF
jgi:hypothetical protein